MSKTKYKVLDLFSGIGGFSLGLERTGGFETVAFCEIEPFCQDVLRKHWANVKCFNDIKELTNERLQQEGIRPDVVCAGFPCQDISVAGRKEGIKGKRSGLFFEIIRLVRDIRPRYVLLENVSNILKRGMGEVLAEFSTLRNYDVEWHCISASSINAPHRRDRVFIIARNNLSNPTRLRFGIRNTHRHTLQEGKVLPSGQQGNSLGNEVERSSSLVGEVRQPIIKQVKRLDRWTDGHEPRVCRMAARLPDWVHRIKALGNSIVPQITEQIGNAILEYEKDINK